MKLVSITPFIAIFVLGIAVFTASPSLDKRVDLTQWKTNQQILLLIESCQDGQLNTDMCESKIPTILDECKSFHVLACDDQRLVGILNKGHAKIGMD